jgi:hypothetical protein
MSLSVWQLQMGIAGRGAVPGWLSRVASRQRHISTSKQVATCRRLLCPNASLPLSVICSSPLQRALGGQALGNCNLHSLLTKSPGLTAGTATTSSLHPLRRCSTSEVPPHDECSEAAAQVPAIQTGGHPRPIKQLCVSPPPHKCRWLTCLQKDRP